MKEMKRMKEMTFDRWKETKAEQKRITKKKLAQQKDNE